MKLKITWFRHTHENRNDLLRFGFMRLHYSGEIEYIEKELNDAYEFGFDLSIKSYPDLRHLSFIGMQSSQTKVRCIVDNEDSFALVSPLMEFVDVYFCAGYNADFFEKKRFVNAYSWQNESDITWYRNTIEKKITSLGDHFHKIRRFIPIAPFPGSAVQASALKQKYKNIEYRLNKLTGKGTNFSDVYKGFETRESIMNDLRNHDMQYDIVLNDSLWGWPRHRLNLHTRLNELHQKNYRIHSVLNWTEPVEHDGSKTAPLNSSLFPYRTEPIKDYELMLAQSRLAVFACGFHWGWRNIMMLALRTGIPVLTDRLLTEPYFDMTEFHLYQQEDHQWRSIEPTLNSIDPDDWEKIKKHNQSVYDKYMSPEAVATYFLQSIEVIPHPHEYITSNKNKWKNPT
jgi:hypothetical protein